MYEGDDMSLDAAPPPEESGNNRAFIIGIAVLGFLIFAALACAGVYLLVLRPRQQAQAQAYQETLAAQDSQIAQALTATAAAMAATATPTIPPATPTVSPTPVIQSLDAAAYTTTPTSLAAQATASLAANFTQVAQIQLTVVPTTTALPGTGFADEVGVPLLLVLALALVAVILLARRLRKSPRLVR